MKAIKAVSVVLAVMLFATLLIAQAAAPQAGASDEKACACCNHASAADMKDCCKGCDKKDGKMACQKDCCKDMAKGKTCCHDGKCEMAKSSKSCCGKSCKMAKAS